MYFVLSELSRVLHSYAKFAYLQVACEAFESVSRSELKPVKVVDVVYAQRFHLYYLFSDCSCG